MTHKVLIAALFAMLFAGDAAAASKQPTKVDAIPAGYKPTAKTDEAELWYILDKIEVDVRQSPRLIRDPALNKYVREVTCKVTANYCNDLRIYIMDVPYFNASMSPNGMMIVWSGALLRMQNEAELALVIGHEFGHYKNRHSLSQFRKAKKSSAFLASFGILTAGSGLDMAAGLIGYANMAKFSRDKEREADQIGFETIVNNGYDPFVGAQLWDRMLREENASDNRNKPIPVFASHPQSKERRDDLQLAAQAVSNPGKKLDVDNYRANTASYLNKWLDNEVSRRMFNASLQTLTDIEPSYPENKKGLFTFYRAEVHRRRNRDDDKAIAANLYQQSVSLPGAPAAAWREHGLVQKAANNKSEATAALEKYLKLSPNADDKAFIDQYLKELKATP
jgi:beta-barrel assembly-enhancing protease